MLEAKIESVHIRGFRSLADVELNDLPDAAVLIGANGSGKSNFIRFFDMLGWMLSAHRLQEFIARQGGADDQLHFGGETTPNIAATVTMKTELGHNEYGFTLTPAHPDRVIFTDEAFRFSRLDAISPPSRQHLGSGHAEANIVEAARSEEFVADGKPVNRKTAGVIIGLLQQCHVYRFNDTSNTSFFKKNWDVRDSRYLRSHGGNLPAVLYRLREEDDRRYDNIRRYISAILPAFDRFELEEQHGRIELRWRTKHSDKSIGARLTSDGSLRLFALVTLLNLPPAMLSDVLLLDGPELGLHPEAIALVGEMLKTMSTQKQVIVATQSPLLVDAFSLDEIVVLDAKNGQTRMRKLDAEQYREWLEDYATGEIWRKNLIGGNP